MNYLTLEDIKYQLRIEQEWDEDNPLLESIGDGAESFLESHLNESLDNITADNGGELPKSLYRALLLLVDYLYDNTGSGDTREMPTAFFMLVAPFKKYAIG